MSPKDGRSFNSDFVCFASGLRFVNFTFSLQMKAWAGRHINLDLLRTRGSSHKPGSVPSADELGTQPQVQ